MRTFTSFFPFLSYIHPQCYRFVIIVVVFVKIAVVILVLFVFLLLKSCYFCRCCYCNCCCCCYWCCVAIIVSAVLFLLLLQKCIKFGKRNLRKVSLLGSNDPTPYPLGFQGWEKLKCNRVSLDSRLEIPPRINSTIYKKIFNSTYLIIFK